MKTIDILLLSYNQKDSIARAIDSVLSQKVNAKTNLMIFDDASTDGTIDIIQKYANVSQIYISETNRGASQNLANALSKCKNEFIAIIEGDDYWSLSNKLQCQLDFLLKNPRYVGCGTDTIGKKPSWIGTRKQSIEKFDGINLCCQTSTLMFKNPFKKEYDFLFSVHPNISDKTLQCDLLTRGQMYRIPKKSVNYSKGNGDNLTSKLYNKPDCYLMDIFVIEKIKEMIEKKQKTSKIHIGERIIFGKAFFYYLTNKSNDALDVIRKMSFETNIPYEIWKKKAIYCIGNALLNKLK